MGAGTVCSIYLVYTYYNYPPSHTSRGKVSPAGSGERENERHEARVCRNGTMNVLNGTIFNNQTGLESDGCYVTQKSLQSAKKGEYLLTNHFNPDGDCDISEPMRVAMSQPGIHFKTHVAPGMYGCDQDHYKALRIDTLNVTPRTKLMLNKRPYLTVPYMGKGVYNPDMHSKMRMGDPVNRNVPEYHANTTHTIDDYPFIPIVRDTVSNPDNYIVESEGWVRGGIPSRDFYRDHSYKNLDGANQN